ncbi:MAG: alpha/beta fold hydrolase, partial [Pseudomonadota bacterium]
QSQFVAITRSRDGYSYTFDDGRLGDAEAVGAKVQCGNGSVLVNGNSVWPKVPLLETNTRFRSGDAMLVGRLIEPPGASNATPLLVHAHGSEPTGWIERGRDPYQMVGRGISVFVYDKRGTGQSEGQYTQNFPLLADDLVAASQEAKRLAGNRFGRFGIVGLSQGGWIAPLAADRAQADFIGIGYGLVADIREEDAAQVQKELGDAGFGGDVLAKARDITSVTARIAASDYTDGLDELTEFQQRYSEEPWFSIMQGSYTGVFLRMSADELRTNGVPQFNNLDIDWSLNPMSVMRGVEAPQLWILAGEDREAPTGLTLERLSILRGEGKDIAIYMFPDTDHGMWEYDQKDDGSRTYLRVTPGFYNLMADWAKDRISVGYGRASVIAE